MSSSTQRTVAMPVRHPRHTSANCGYVIPDFGSLWPDPQITFLPNGWGIALADIGPDLAKAMLAYNAGNQRPEKETPVAKYIRDMECGVWRLTHQGIAFNVYGELHDGQHRLTAVVESGQVVPMWVWFGAGGRDEMTVIDTNSPRTLLDAARVNGRFVTGRLVTILNAAVRYGVKNASKILSTSTQTQRVEWLVHHIDAVTFVENAVGSGKLARSICRAPVSAAIACAYYHVDRDRLARFVQVLTDQVDPLPGEEVCKVLRHFIQTNEGGGEFEVFLKTCRSIQYYLVGQHPASSRLYACSENPYPFPLMSASVV